MFNKCHQWDFTIGRLCGGLGFYTYQLALGVSLRYWKCTGTPSIRIHFGPLKLWVGVHLKRQRGGESV